MPDNVPITPGSGTNIASREVAYSGQTVQVQVVGLAMFSGADDAKTVTDISVDNPLPIAAYGELIEVLEAMRMALSSLTKSIGYLMPNAQGFPMVEARQTAAANLNATVAQATATNLNAQVTIAGGQTLGIVSTLTNQSQFGGFAANDKIPALMHMQADNLRRNITVT